MAICKMCHKTIPDGMDFCEECELKRTNQADESYLDSLLSSVSADLSNYSESVFENVSKHIAPKKPQSVTKEVLNTEETTKEEPVTEEETIVLEEIPSEEVISEEIPSEEIIPEDIPSELQAEDIPLKAIPSEDTPSEEAAADDTVAEVPADIDALFEEVPVEEAPIAPVAEEIPANIPDITEPDIPEAADDSDEDVDELLDSLLADMEKAGPEEPASDEPDLAPDDISDIFASVDPTEGIEITEEAVDETAEEPSDAIDITAMDIPSMDIPSVDELSQATPGDIEPIAAAEEGALPGIEEIDFSTDNIDSLKLDTIDIMTPVEGGSDTVLGEPELESTEAGASDEFDVTAVMNDIESGDFEKQIAEITPKEKRENNKKVKTWFDKLFGNVIEERTPEQEKALQEKLLADEEKKKQKEEEKKQKKALSKEEKEAQKAEQKAQKEEEAKKKAEEKKQKAAEAKEKAQKKKEERLALEAAEAVNEGRINRVGASILFVIFAILTVIIIVGSNIYSYNLSIRNAQNEFDIKHYNDAYYEVYGLKIQDEDIDLYDKIMTVMYVNTQLNAYQYYMRSNNKELALDSLLKGLQRYDKYLELATILDIENDLNYVKSNILTELANEFGIDETSAKNMVEARDEVDYSEYIYTLLGTYEVDFGE